MTETLFTNKLTSARQRFVTINFAHWSELSDIA